MTCLIFCFCAALIQLSSAQVLSYVQRNSVPQQALEAPVRYVANAANTPNNAVPVARVPVGMALATNAVGANANANIANTNANIANANIAAVNSANAIANQNAAINYAANQNMANANYAANYANALAMDAMNYAGPNVGYVANAAVPAAIANVVNTVANANSIADANIILEANALANANAISSTNLANAALAKAAIENINGNTATFNLGTNGNSFTVTSGSPGAQGFGLSIIADALEVGGTVAVNGQIPIFGAVAVNGNVPTDGAATVSYNCGGKQLPIPI